MIRISGLTLARGDRVLVKDAQLAVHAGHRVGIVGANGCGKSSLFAALRGELIPDAGSIELPPRWVVAHVAQDTPAVATAAIDYVQDGDAELRSIEHALADAALGHATAGAALGHATADAATPRSAGDAPLDGAPPGGALVDGTRLAELHHRFDEIDGYRARARAATLLAGLGFDEAAQKRPVDSFSGGMRMRLNLAQALMCRSDLLLLDEPTNHLDLDAVLWLEEWLRRYPGTLLLVTHDRDVLDTVAQSIVHFDSGKLVLYSGNYAQFERERAQRLAQQQASYVRQQRQIAHLRSYVDRFRAKATKARQAQSRLKALERMELVASAHADSPFEFSFVPGAAHARQLVRLAAARIGYDATRPVMANVDWAVLATSRIGLLGANGAGKSTLLKSLAGTLPLLAGDRHAATGLRLGYFAQHQVEALRSEETPLWHVKRLEPDTREQALRDYLGGFDFRGNLAMAPVSQLSGGEKARLALALIVRQRPNLLLLDEPTNHLDLEMREALTEALQDYDGALIVVAHDRHLLRATADELWLVESGTLAPFEGDLDDYRGRVLSSRAREATADAAPRDAMPTDATTTDATTTNAMPRDARSAPETGAVATSDAGPDRRQRKRDDARERQRKYDARKPHLAEQTRLEAEITSLSAEKRSLDAWLATPQAYEASARDALVAALERQGELTWMLARAEAAWLDLEERLDALD